MRLKAVWRLIKASVSAWSEDYAPSMGAAIAYYTLFSIAPLLVIVIAIAGLVFGAEAAQNAIVAQLESRLASLAPPCHQGCRFDHFETRERMRVDHIGRLIEERNEAWKELARRRERVAK